jgi:hypothetical protein
MSMRKMDPRATGRYLRSDVVAMTGITPIEFERWCQKGVIKPVAWGSRGNATSGMGYFASVDFMQVLGIAVAVRLRRSERSCSLVFCKLVIEAFGNMTEERLLAFWEEHPDWIYFVAPHEGKPYLYLRIPDAIVEECNLGWVEVRGLHRLLKAKAEEIEAMPRTKSGRRPARTT